MKLKSINLDSNKWLGYVFHLINTAIVNEQIIIGAVIFAILAYLGYPTNIAQCAAKLSFLRNGYT